MIPDEPFLVFALEKNNENEEEENDNVGYIYVNDLCPYSWNPMFLIFPSFCSFLVLLVSSFHCLLS